MENLLEPPSYNAGEHIFDLAFHPTNNIMACTLITGETKLVSYGLDKTEELLTLQNHKDSVRTCAFAPSGSYLATASSDKSLAIIDTNGKLALKIKRAHDDPINCVKFLSDELVVTGDDEGCIKVWNLREGKAIWEVMEQEGTITDMTFEAENNFLLATSTNGDLGVYDMRKGNNSKKKLYALSDSMNEDLLALSLVRNGKKVLCSSQEGCIYVFKWDWFGDCKDRILGHPNSIDAMIKLDENTVLTGSEDGYIRAVGLNPNKILNYVGNHSESDEIQPVTRLAMTHDMKYVASLSLDNWVKFHNITSLAEERKVAKINDDDDDDDDEEEGGMEREEDYDDDDSDEDDMGRGKQKMPRKPDVKTREREIKKEKKQNFFSDL